MQNCDMRNRYGLNLFQCTLVAILVALNDSSDNGSQTLATGKSKQSKTTTKTQLAEYSSPYYLFFFLEYPCSWIEIGVGMWGVSGN